MIDKEYQKENTVSLDSVRISGNVSFADGEGGNAAPDVNDNRGSGLYTEESEKYNSGAADNYLPTVGIEGNITLGVTDVDGDGALQFVHSKDAESRFQFIAGTFEESFVFETDIKFDVLPDGKSRGIQIFGAKTQGVNGNVWAGATINLEYSEDKECYVLKAAGGEFAVTRGKWINIRLEVDGTEVGSTVRFYVNGKLYGISKLTGSIASVTAYEVLTPKGSGDGASFVGIVSFDNTYIGEKLHDTPSTLPESGDSNVSGDDMDGDAWDENK